MVKEKSAAGATMSHVFRTMLLTATLALTASASKCDQTLDVDQSRLILDARQQLIQDTDFPSPVKWSWIELRGVTIECRRCDPASLANATTFNSGNATACAVVNGARGYPWRLEVWGMPQTRYTQQDRAEVVALAMVDRKWLGDKGEYRITLMKEDDNASAAVSFDTENASSSSSTPRWEMHIHMTHDPDDIWAPLVTAGIVLAVMAFVFSLMSVAAAARRAASNTNDAAALNGGVASTSQQEQCCCACISGSGALSQRSSEFLSSSITSEEPLLGELGLDADRGINENRPPPAAVPPPPLPLPDEEEELESSNCCAYSAYQRASAWRVPSSDRPRPGDNSVQRGRIAQGATAHQQHRSKLAERLQTRLRSLDAFRGLTLTLMVFVNYGGGGYYFLQHSAWNGLTIADVLFPSFIWISGVATALSLESAARRGLTRAVVARKVVVRGIVLVVIGVALNNGVTTRAWRFPGVLQYFGIAQFLAILPAVVLRPPAPAAAASAPSWSCLYWREWCWATTVLLGGWMLLTFVVPVPGCPTGYLGPGGLSDHSKHEECVGGAHKRVDTVILGKHHLFNSPTCDEVYKCGVYDPEGLVGSLTASLLLFLGLTAGRAIFVQRHVAQRLLTPRARVARLLGRGAITSFVGGFLCLFGSGGGIPINKNLWTPSFVFLVGGMAHGVLAVLYVVIDVMHWWNGGPFFQVGMNSLLVYVGHELLQGYFPFSFSWRHAHDHGHRLAQNLVGAGVWVVISCILHWRRLYLSI